MNNGLVRFKGIADGVCICLDNAAPMYELLEELEKKISLNRNFFGAGSCRIAFSGRTLTASEKRRLSELILKMMPLARVEFEQPKRGRHDPAEWVNEYKEKHSGAKGAEGAKDAVQEENERADGTAPHENEREAGEDKEDRYEEEFLSKLRSPRAKLYQCILHEGARLESDGHLILLGTAEPGSELAAAGDIIVIGGLYGTAHAGCYGHNGSYIIAVDMRPEKLAIADMVYTPPEVSEEIKEETEEKHRLFGRLRKKNETPSISEDSTQDKVYTAIALCKNHKIILDNFTIKTFTNPKNMI